MKIRKAIQTAALMMGALATAPAATIDFLGNDPTRGMDITIQADGQTVTWFSGFTNLILDGMQQQSAFCVDAFTEIWNGTHHVVLEDPSSLSNGARVAWLMQNLSSTVTTASQAAGMQLAIWDIVHDNGDGLSLGRIQGLAATDAAVASATAGFIAASVGQASLNATVYSNIAGRDAAQALMSCGANGGTCDGATGVPEPSTLVTFGIGIAAIAAGARRRSV
jgi:hypothetical protein